MECWAINSPQAIPPRAWEIFAPHLCRSHANIHFLCCRNKGSHLEPGQAVQARKVLYVTSADVEAGSVPGTADSSFGQNPCMKDSIATSVHPCPQPTRSSCCHLARAQGAEARSHCQYAPRILEFTTAAERG